MNTPPVPIGEVRRGIRLPAALDARVVAIAQKENNAWGATVRRLLSDAVSRAEQDDARKAPRAKRVS